MKAKDLLELIKPIADDVELMTYAENPNLLEFDDEPDLTIDAIDFDEERNTIFLVCQTTISRVD